MKTIIAIAVAVLVGAPVAAQQSQLEKLMNVPAGAFTLNELVQLAPEANGESSTYDRRARIQAILANRKAVSVGGAATAPVVEVTRNR